MSTLHTPTLALLGIGSALLAVCFDMAVTRASLAPPACKSVGVAECAAAIEESK